MTGPKFAGGDVVVRPHLGPPAVHPSVPSVGPGLRVHVQALGASHYKLTGPCGMVLLSEVRAYASAIGGGSFRTVWRINSVGGDVLVIGAGRALDVAIGLVEGVAG